MDKPFGSTLHMVGVTVRGKITKDSAAQILGQITDRIGMSKVHWPVLYDYPADGKGGKGFTRIQPITESFLAFDAWPDLNGAYLIVCSCRNFDIGDVRQVLRDNNLELIETKRSILELPQ